MRSLENLLPLGRRDEIKDVWSDFLGSSPFPSSLFFPSQESLIEKFFSLDIFAAHCFPNLLCMFSERGRDGKRRGGGDAARAIELGIQGRWPSL